MSREDKSYSEEYASYLERHELFGRDWPKLGPKEFDRLDAEGQGLTGAQEERYLELMYLLVAE